MTLERRYRQTVAVDAGTQEQRMTAEKILRKFRVCGITLQDQPYGELIRAGQLPQEQCHIHQQLSPRSCRRNSPALPGRQAEAQCGM